MTRFEYQFPHYRYLPSVTARGSSTKLPPTLRGSTTRGRPSGRRHPVRKEGQAEETAGDVSAANDLDYLTDSDREFLHAVTGEVIEPGQRPQDRPLSALAMQVAVDRKCGGLSAGVEISAGYLRRMNRLFLQLNVPSNPFSGEVLERALGYLDRTLGVRLPRSSFGQDEHQDSARLDDDAEGYADEPDQQTAAVENDGEPA